MSDSLHTIDYTVIVLYFAAIVACGIYFGRYTKVDSGLLLWWSTFRLVVESPRHVLLLLSVPTVLSTILT